MQTQSEWISDAFCCLYFSFIQRRHFSRTRRVDRGYTASCKADRLHQHHLTEPNLNAGKCACAKCSAVGKLALTVLLHAVTFAARLNVQEMIEKTRQSKTKANDNLAGRKHKLSPKRRFEVRSQLAFTMLPHASFVQNRQARLA